MPTYPLYQVDAFTTSPLGGNPCAILFDCANLSDAVMLAIAKEMNLSETSFVWQKPDGHFRALHKWPCVCERRCYLPTAKAVNFSPIT